MRTEVINGLIKIKIFDKKGKRSYSLKKLPVFIGSSKGENILSVHSPNIEDRHGKVFNIKNKIYYHDLSEQGSVVNNKFIRQKKVLLIPGTNDVLIGQVHIVVQNDYSLDYGISHSDERKRFWQIFGGVVGIMLLIITGVFIYKQLFETNSLTLKNFELSQDTLQIQDKFFVKSLTFNENLDNVDLSKINFVLMIGEKDSINLRYSDVKQKTKFNLLVNPLPVGELEKSILFTLYGFSNEYEIPKRSKYILVSNSKQRVRNGPVMLETNITGRLFSYLIECPNCDVSKINIDYGDGEKVINGVSRYERPYLRSGIFYFKAEVFLKGKNKPYILERKVTIK